MYLFAWLGLILAIAVMVGIGFALFQIPVVGTALAYLWAFFLYFWIVSSATGF
jgi:hypothetical protein